MQGPRKLRNEQIVIWLHNVGNPLRRMARWPHIIWAHFALFLIVSWHTYGVHMYSYMYVCMQHQNIWYSCTSELYIHTTTSPTSALWSLYLDPHHHIALPGWKSKENNYLTPYSFGSSCFIYFIRIHAKLPSFSLPLSLSLSYRSYRF